MQQRPSETTSWIELSLDTTHEAVDWVCTLLATAHFTGDIQLANYKADRSKQPDWAFTLCLVLPNSVHARTQVDAIADLLSPLHRTGLTTALEVAVLKDRPRQTDPLVYRVGQRFVILNADAAAQLQPGDIPLKIKTTLSFGSGLHPATRLSLKLLERYALPAMSALDLGSGSGILSVAMAKLGAQVLALDNDAIAVRATQDAVQLNGVEQQVTVREGSLGLGSDLGHWMNGEISATVPSIAAQAEFDLIVANILARMHIALAPDFQRALRQTKVHPGFLITAGFTLDRESEVNEALIEAGFEAIDCERSNEWVALAHRLKVA